MKAERASVTCSWSTSKTWQSWHPSPGLSSFGDLNLGGLTLDLQLLLCYFYKGQVYSFCPAAHTEHRAESCGSGVPRWFWNSRTGLAPGDSAKHPEGTQGPLPASGTRKKVITTSTDHVCPELCCALYIKVLLEFDSDSVQLPNSYGDFDISVKYTC